MKTYLLDPKGRTVVEFEGKLDKPTLESMETSGWSMSSKKDYDRYLADCAKVLAEVSDSSISVGSITSRTVDTVEIGTKGQELIRTVSVRPNTSGEVATGTVE
jgi:hypothetical protein